MRLGAGDVGSSEPGRLRVLPTHSLLEESYVMKDPFSPDKQHFLILGSRCSACGRLVCVSPVGGPGCGSGGRGGSERLVVGGTGSGWGEVALPQFPRPWHLLHPLLPPGP